MCEDAPCCGCCGNDDYGYGEYYAEDFYDRQERYEAYYDDEDDEDCTCGTCFICTYEREDENDE